MIEASNFTNQLNEFLTENNVAVKFVVWEDNNIYHLILCAFVDDFNSDECLGFVFNQKEKIP